MQRIKVYTKCTCTEIQEVCVYKKCIKVHTKCTCMEIHEVCIKNEKNNYITIPAKKNSCISPPSTPYVYMECIGMRKKNLYSVTTNINTHKYFFLSY